MRKIICVILLIASAISCRPFELPESRSVLNVTEATLDGVNSTVISITAMGVATQCERIEGTDIISMEDTANGQIITYRISIGVINTTCGSSNGDGQGSGGSGAGEDVLLVPISVPIRFEYSGSGAYIFRFLRTDNTFFEKTISVNN